MLFSAKPALLRPEEINALSETISLAEKGTSGEIRLYMEGRCSYVDPQIRAQEIFVQLGMHRTHFRNGLLIYIAYRDHDFALIGDKGIYEVADPGFWAAQARALGKSFHHKQYLAGIRDCVMACGDLLRRHFPGHEDDKNELPDEIVFRK